MFRHRQQLSRWAARVLLLWLFGLGARFANACLTTGYAVHVASSDGRHSAAAEVHHETALHQDSTASQGAVMLLSAEGEGHQDGATNANCLDFCDKATVSIPPLKSALDDLQSHAVISAVHAAALPMPAYSPVRLWRPRRDGVWAPPIRIAFLRLAL